MQAKKTKHEKKAVNQFSCAMELVPFTSVTFLHVTQGMKLTIVRSVVCVGSGVTRITEIPEYYRNTGIPVKNIGIPVKDTY